MGEPSGESQDHPPAAPSDGAPAVRRKGADLAWVASTNFGEGLPWSVIHQMGTDYLTAVNAPLAQIGYTSWLHLATTLKFLWSPIVDLAGKKRTWMVVLQFLLGLGMVAVGVVSRAGASGLRAFWIALGALAIVHATHDIACDGYYLLALSRSRQALYAGPRVAAYRAAMLVGSSALIYLAGRTSYLIAFAAAGALMTLVALGNALFVPRIAEPQRPAGAARHPKEYGAAYRTFFAQPHIVVVLLFIFSIKLGDIMMFSMARPLLRDIGVSTAQRGLLGTPSLLAQIGGAIVAGWVVSRYGLQRSLTPIVFFMNLAIPLYVLLAWATPPFRWVVPIVVIEQFAGGMGATAQSVYLMQRCRRAYSASHYAFATAITAIGTTFSGAFSGHLNAALGHRWYFVACFVFGIPSMILVLLVPKQPLEG
jgi:PAT family beta-lactamase induction signal transducer AmpG